MVPALTAFKVIQLLIMAVFGVIVSDLRTKPGMKPLLDVRLIRVMKIDYLLAIGSYVYTLIRLDRVLWIDLLCLGTTLLATLLAAKAKWDLGSHHTWTGHCLAEPRLCTRGIYAYVRHPFYAAVYAFVLAAWVTVLSHAHWALTAVAGAAAAYIAVFLAVSASRETKAVEKCLGEPFAAYRRRVHPFLPLRKWDATDPPPTTAPPAAP
jgi:protein-S-isoprenylcysteine O-methyltransferase Ste14